MYARYTVVLKNLLENPEVNAKIHKALSTYPLYAKRSPEEFIPSYIPTREELNQKILNHYKYREIGFETVGRFIDELEISMNEIMPKYNLLFNSADLDFNIIYNVDYVKTLDTDKSGESSSNVKGNDKTTTNTESTSGQTVSGTDSSETKDNNTSTSKDIQSQTPQNELSITGENIDSVSYADNAKWGKNTANGTATHTGESSSTSSGNTTGSNVTEGNNTVDSSGEHSETEKTVETTKGNYGVVSAQELVRKYRETIVNIEQMIIEDERIAELFMLVY